MPIYLSPRPVRAFARRVTPGLQAALLRLLIAFSVAALATIALVHGYDSIVLVGLVALTVAALVRLNTELTAL